MKNYIIHFSVTVLTIFIIPSFLGATGDIEIKKSLEKTHRTTLIYLSNRQSTHIKTHFKNYYVASYCSGSFKNAGDYETVVGMVNLKAKIIKYVALVYDNAENVKSYLVAEFNDVYEPENNIEYISVECHSVMGIKRINKTILKSKDSGAGIHGRIEPINEYDTICITTKPTEFKCFQYDHKLDQFITVGGWIT